MSAIKFDDIRAGADAKYPDYEIEQEDGKIIAFRPVFRLPSAKRAKVAEAFDISKRLEALTEDDQVDQSKLMCQVFADTFLLIERTKGDGAALKKWAGMEDLGMWLYLFNDYSEVTQLGEALSLGS